MAHEYFVPEQLPTTEVPSATCFDLAYKLCKDLAGDLTPKAGTDLLHALNLGWSDNALICVNSTQGTWLVKMPRKLCAESVSACRDEGFRAKWVGQTGVAPEVFTVDRRTGAFIMSYIEAHSLTSDEVSQRLPDVMELLHKFHDQVPSKTLEAFSAFDLAKTELAQASEESACTPSDLAKLSGVLKRAESLAAPSKRLTACHNDFWSSNILCDGIGKLWLVDFQFAGLGDPLYDVGYLATELRINPREVALAYGLRDPNDQLKVVAYYHTANVWLAAYCARRPQIWQTFVESYLSRVRLAAEEREW